MRRFSILIIAFCMVMMCNLVVYAHPGRTDANGGHWDNSTGEYHYHHGYSAHDHYDMDGDGAADCPYNFADKTDYNSSSSTHRSNASNSNSYYDNNPPETVTVYKDREVIKEVPFTPPWIKWTLAITLIWTICLSVSGKWKKQEISELEEKVRNQAEEAKQQKEANAAALLKKDDDHRSQIAYFRKHDADQFNKLIGEKNNLIMSLQSENDRLQCELHSVITAIPVGEAYYPEPSNPELTLHRIEIPKDVYFIEGNIPVKGVVTSYDPFGDFTVFTLKNSAIYHTNKYCSGTFNMEPVHLFDVMGRKRPCLRCGKNHGTAPPQWYTELIALRKYCK